MDIRNIETFIRVAEVKNFTKVAQELNYAQSTVTAQIQQLEQELGYPLFDRVGKKVFLTSLGREFLKYAYKIKRAVQDASGLNKGTEEFAETLRVGCLESLLFGDLMKLIPDFKRRHRNLDLQLKLGQAEELVHLLKQNQLDVVYVNDELRANPEFQCCYKREERLVFLCSPEHPLAKQKVVSLETILKEDFIVTERTGICYKRLQELVAMVNAEWHISVEVDSAPAAIALTQENLGVTFLPEYSAKKQLKEGTLTRLDVENETQYIYIYYVQLLRHKDRWASPLLTEFIDAIKGLESGD